MEIVSLYCDKQNNLRPWLWQDYNTWKKLTLLNKIEMFNHNLTEIFLQYSLQYSRLLLKVFTGANQKLPIGKKSRHLVTTVQSIHSNLVYNTRYVSSSLFITALLYVDDIVIKRLNEFIFIYRFFSTICYISDFNLNKMAHSSA